MHSGGLFGSTLLLIRRLHMHITRLYARLGVTKAQSLLSQYLLRGAQTEGEIHEAVHWLRKAAKQGDPLANYNLVVAHLKKHTNSSGLTMNEAIQMLQHASNHGIAEADQFLNHCPDGPRCIELERKLVGNGEE
ncbi:hypothetical protein FGIG_07088 [Fasciola gigantica]|uniref:Sel1 repeat family protein n=1 Tax=Fasciola gigantica TaxID=46835 RepID=A0A504Z9B8_FASGI|nr:hypothetical protein FGIG_07088 [Fasciola gigantica]